MLAVVAPVLHNNDPVKLLAVKVDVPSQLLTTPTDGAPGIVLTVSSASLLAAGAHLPLIDIARYLFPFNEVVVPDRLNVEVVSPLTVEIVRVYIPAVATFVHVVPPSVLTCHCTAGVGTPPVDFTVKLADVPSHFVCGCGSAVIVGVTQQTLSPKICEKE